MARGRILSKSLSTSRRFALAGQHGGRLGEFCQLLFPLLNSHADDFGRLAGDAFTVKALVLPTSPRKEADFERALSALESVGLIRRAAVDGQWVIQVIGFDDHQTGLHKRTKSQYPEIPNKNTIRPEVPGSSGKYPEIPSEEKGIELKGREGNRTEPRARACEVAFDRFWIVYPKKVGKDAARAAWEKRTPSEALTVAILAAVEAQKASYQWQRDGGQFIPNPATWLNQGRWQDEIAPPPPKTEDVAARLKRELGITS